VKGKVTNWQPEKKTGFIQAEGLSRGVFFHIDDVQDDSKDKIGKNAALEFVLVEPEPAKGPKATNITVAKAGEKTEKSKNFYVEWLPFGEPILTPDKDALMLPVWVVTKHGDKIAPGIKATLNANGVPQTLPAAEATSGADGKVFFRIYLVPEAVECDLCLSAQGQFHVTRWERKDGTGKPDSIEIKQGKRHVGDTLTFITKCGDKPCKGKIVISVKGSIASLEHTLNSDRAEKLPVTWETNGKGILTAKFNRREFNIRVTGTLANDETKSCSCDLMTV
jgi:cold shock CspA family protein